mmetsp:Transcript_84719/g.254071  ORF Transcript_84719/g.254071 Transcript_84719/m.254071 type:complete len:113 (-) Transcript_84719:30-368(-)
MGEGVLQAGGLLTPRFVEGDPGLPAAGGLKETGRVVLPVSSPVSAVGCTVGVVSEHDGGGMCPAGVRVGHKFSSLRGCLRCEACLGGVAKGTRSGGTTAVVWLSSRAAHACS